jgi:F-box domain
MNDPKASKETTVAPSGEGGMRNLPSLLPLELQRHIFSFLNPTDAVALSCALPTSIVVRKLKPDRCFNAGIHKFAPGIRRLPMVVNLSKGIVHSMTFCAQWKNGDDGGRVVIVALRRRSSGEEPTVIPLPIDSGELVDADPYGTGHVVAKTDEMAPNEWKHVELTFTPCEGFVYYLKFSKADVRNGFLQTRIYDSTDGSFSKTFQVLHRLDVISCSKMVFSSPPNVNDFLIEYEYVLIRSDTPEARATRKGCALAFPSLFLRCVQQGLVNSDQLDHLILDPVLKDLSDGGLRINKGTLHAAETILQSFIDELNYDWEDYEIRWRLVDDNLHVIFQDGNEDEDSQTSEASAEDDNHEVRQDVDVDIIDDV